VATSVKLPSAAVVTDNAGSAVTWAGATNVYSDNATNATCTVSGTTASDFLDITGFAMAIPAGVTINGITVDSNCYRSGGTTGNVRDNTVQLIIGGTATGNNKATATSWATGTTNIYTFGGAADLWGLTPTVSQLNASNFGVRIAVRGAASGANRIANIDYVQITVTYTEPTADSGSFALSGNDVSFIFRPIGAFIPQIATNTKHPKIDNSSQVNYKNPLTKGIKFLHVGGGNIDLVGKRRATISGTAQASSIVYAQEGRAYRSDMGGTRDGLSYPRDSQLEPTKTTGYTHFCYARVSGTVPQYGGGGVQRLNSETAYNCWGYLINPGGANQNELVTIFGDSTGTQWSGTVNLVDSTKPFFVVSTRLTTGVVKTYLNGILVDTQSSLTSESTYDATSNVLISNNGSTDVFAVGLWNRALSDDEIYSLSKNPWQLLTTRPVAVKKPVRAWLLDAANEAFALAGQAVGFCREVVNLSGAFSLSGQDASTLWSDRVFTAAAEAFSLAGQDAVALWSDRIFPAVSGAFDFVGQEASTLWSDRIFPAVSGAFDFVGQTAITLWSDRIIPAASGAFDFVGQIATTLWSDRIIPAASGAFDFVGQTVSALWSDRVFTAASGAYDFVGQTIDLWYERFINAVSGAFSLSGTDAWSLPIAFKPIFFKSRKTRTTQPKSITTLNKQSVFFNGLEFLQVGTIPIDFVKSRLMVRNTMVAVNSASEVGHSFAYSGGGGPSFVDDDGLHPSDSTGFTLCVYAKRTGTIGSDAFLVSKHADSGTNPRVTSYMIQCNVAGAGQNQFRILTNNGAAPNYSASFTVPDTAVPYKIVFTRKDGVLKTYVDGKWVGTSSGIGSGWGSSTGSAGRFIISYLYSGDIYQVATWNRALSDSEIYDYCQRPWQLFVPSNGNISWATRPFKTYLTEAYSEAFALAGQVAGTYVDRFIDALQGVYEFFGRKTGSFDGNYFALPLSGRSRVTRQSQISSRLDHANPLTAGIVDAANLSVQVSAKGWIPSVVSTFRQGITKHGKGYWPAGATSALSYANPALRGKTGQSFTVAAFYTLVSVPGGSVRVISNLATASSGYSLAPSNTNFRGVIAKSPSNYILVGSAVATGDRIEVMTFNGTVGNFFENGVQTVTNQAASYDEAPSRNFDVGYETAGGQGPADAITYMWAYWDRCLTVKEVQDFSRNPWQIFAKTQGKVFIRDIPASPLIERKVFGDEGGYTLSGKDATFLSDRLAAGESGVFVLSGKDAGLYADRVTDAGAGDFVLSGQQADLLNAKLATGDSGAFAFAGQDAIALVDRLLASGAATFALVGQDLIFVYTPDQDLVLTGDGAVYLLTGQDAAKISEYYLELVNGELVLTGKSVDLLADRVVSGVKGDYALDGKDAGTLFDRLLVSASGAYDLVGQAVGKLSGYALIGVESTFNFVGQIANTFWSDRIFTAASGAYDFAGQSVEKLFGYALICVSATYDLVGQIANTLWSDRKFTGDSGAFDLVGQAAEKLFGYAVIAVNGTFDFVGQSASTLWSDRIFTAASGAYDFAGQTVNKLFGYAIVAAEGTFEFIGQIAGVLWSDRIFTAASGAYDFVGQVAGTFVDRLLTFASGTFDFVGQIATTLWSNRSFIADAGTYDLAGQIAGKISGYAVTAASGAYALAGQAVDTLVDRILEAGAAAYTLIGQATLAIGDFILFALSAEFELAGQAANKLSDYALSAINGAYSLVGQAVDLFWDGRALVSDSGVFELIGQAATKLSDYALAGVNGAYALVGQAVDLLWSDRKFLSDGGEYNLVGQVVAALFDRMTVGNKGDFDLSGQDAETLADRKVGAGAGDYLLTGQISNLLAGRLVSVGSGSFEFTGNDGVLLHGWYLGIGGGEFTLSGQDSGRILGKNIIGEPAELVLTGQDATLLATRILTGDTTEFVLNGMTIALTYTPLGHYVLNGDYTIFALTPADAGLLLDRYLGIDPGAFALVGQAAGRVDNRVLMGQDAGFIWTGKDSILLANHATEAGSGDFLLQLNDGALFSQKVLGGAPAGYYLDGKTGLLLAGRAITGEATDFLLGGIDAGLYPGRCIVSEMGSFTVNGEAATFIWHQLMHYLLTASGVAYELQVSDAELLATRLIAADSGFYQWGGVDQSMELITSLSVFQLPRHSKHKIIVKSGSKMMIKKYRLPK
jgi:hypothetical protein